MLILGLLVALLPGQRSEISVTDYVAAADCSTRCNLTPAISRALAAAELVPTPAGMRPQGSLIKLPCGDFDISAPIIITREHTVRGCGGSGWGPPTLLRVTTSTHGIVVLPLAGWADIADVALVTTVPSNSPDRYGVFMKGKAFVRGVMARGPFVSGFYLFGDDAKQRGWNVNGALLEYVKSELSEYAGIYIGGDNAGAVVLTAPEVSYACSKGNKWTSSIQGVPCAGLIDYSMMGATLVGGQSAVNFETVGTSRILYPNVHLRRTTALGVYTENAPGAPNVLEVDVVALGGILANQPSAGPGFKLYGLQATGLHFYGTPAAGETARPEIWVGGTDQPPGTVLTLVPPQSGSAFPSYMALRLKMDITPGKRGWKRDLQNSAGYTVDRILIDPPKQGVLLTRTSSKVVP